MAASSEELSIPGENPDPVLGPEHLKTEDLLDVPQLTQGTRDTAEIDPNSSES